MTTGYVLLHCPHPFHPPGVCNCLTPKPSLRASWFQIPLPELLQHGGNPLYSAFTASRHVGYLDVPLPRDSHRLLTTHHSAVPSIARHLAAHRDARTPGYWDPPKLRAAPLPTPPPTPPRRGSAAMLPRTPRKQMVGGGGEDGALVGSDVGSAGSPGRKGRTTVPEEELRAEKRQCRRCLKVKVQAEMDPFTRACRRCKAYSEMRMKEMKERRLREVEAMGVTPSKRARGRGRG